MASAAVNGVDSNTTAVTGNMITPRQMLWLQPPEENFMLV
jgi:hypothetical protein